MRIEGGSLSFTRLALICHTPASTFSPVETSQETNAYQRTRVQLNRLRSSAGSRHGPVALQAALKGIRGCEFESQLGLPILTRVWSSVMSATVGLCRRRA
jgi:hypothetical protein